MQVTYSADGTTLVKCTGAQGIVRVREGCLAIASRAFMYEVGLEGVEFPDSLIRIEDYAFACTGIRAFRAPAHLESIGTKAFFKNPDLTQVKLNRGLQRIGPDAFSLTSIDELEIPASVECMDRAVAMQTPLWASGTHALTIDQGNRGMLVDATGGLYRKMPGGLELFGMSSASLRHHEPLEGTVVIGPKAYRGLESLESVVLPQGVREIGDEAFRKCGALESITLPDSLECIGARAFFDTALGAIRLPASLREIGEEALLTGDGTERTLKHMEVDALSGHFYLENGILCERGAAPDGGDLARGFFGAGKKIVIPSQVTGFSAHAFARCNSIDELRVGTQVRSVPPSSLITRTFIDHIVFELDEPICGSTQLDLCFTHSRGSRLMLGIAIDKYGLDPTVLVDISDDAVICMRDIFKRSSRLLRRLSLPQMLGEARRQDFIKRLRRDLLPTCQLFAQRGYLEGFEELERHGLFDASNIQEVVEVVMSVGDAASVAHMLAIRKRLGVTREAMTI